MTATISPPSRATRSAAFDGVASWHGDKPGFPEGVVDDRHRVRVREDAGHVQVRLDGAADEGVDVPLILSPSGRLAAAADPQRGLPDQDGPGVAPHTSASRAGDVQEGRAPVAEVEVDVVTLAELDGHAGIMSSGDPDLETLERIQRRRRVDCDYDVMPRPGTHGSDNPAASRTAGSSTSCHSNAS